MPVVKGGLFSLVASGSLAKLLVYSVWKGIYYVRTYVVPANPKSTLQQAQRAYFKDGVERGHLFYTIALDKAAWGRWARVLPTSMSGWNKVISEVIKVRRAGNVWADPLTLLVTPVAATTATITVRQGANDAGMTVPVYVGVNQGFMPLYGNASWSAENTRYERNLTGLPPGTTHFFRIKMSKAGQDAWIGDGTFKTLAA